ncbi:MAG: sensor histidine kinase, partial [Acidimicrobiales bacterium]
MDLPTAARYLELDEPAVHALVGVGYLRPTESIPAALFELADLKAFIARNADNGSGNITSLLEEEANPQSLLDALDGRSEEMARRAFDIFAAAFPEAQQWSLGEQARFIDQARNRFEAILAVTGQGSAVDEALVGDLQDVGAAAAWSGSPLPHLLAILRISRDLVVQTAVEIAEQRGRHWGLALSLLLTRVLPAMDRLTDALAQGYWAALVGREEDLRDRYQHVVDTAPAGVFEVDLDGRIQYANAALSVILGCTPEQLDGVPLRDVVVPADPAVSIEPLMSNRPAGQVQLTVVRPDGVRRELDVSTTVRFRFDELLGFQGVVRDVTAERDLERSKNEFLALVTRDLRSPLAGLLAQGANLEAHADELPADQVARIGGAIRSQAERISRLADDLYDMSRIEASQLTLRTRAVDLAHVVHAALASVKGPPTSESVHVSVPEGVEVMADPRRLEQVLANLVENGLVHGAPPVVVAAEHKDGGLVEVSVSDNGPGVDPARVETLWRGLRSR